MAEYSVNYLSNLINEQIESRENLNEFLSKAVALSSITLSGDFLAFPQVTLYCFLWGLSDLVEKARELNEQALNLLIARLPH